MVPRPPRVLESGLRPVIDGSLAGRDGGQIAAGTLRECFEAGASAHLERYPA